MPSPHPQGYWDAVAEDEELEGEEKRFLLNTPSEKSKCERRCGPYHNPSWPVPKIDERISHIVPLSTTSLWDIAIDYRDLNTRDDWIPRHGDLPRLGVKEGGFRAESIITDFEFLTNRSLLFVKNHHAVPP